jgi:hypothetical protein
MFVWNASLHDAKTQNNIISDMFGVVRASEMKLKLFRNEFENVNLCQFSACDLLYRDGAISVPLPSVRAVEITDSLV